MEMVTFTLKLFYSQEKAFETHWTGVFVDPKFCLDIGKVNLLSVPGAEL